MNLPLLNVISVTCTSDSKCMLTDEPISLRKQPVCPLAAALTTQAANGGKSPPTLAPGCSPGRRLLPAQAGHVLLKDLEGSSPTLIFAWEDQFTPWRDIWQHLRQERGDGAPSCLFSVLVFQVHHNKSCKPIKRPQSFWLLFLFYYSFHTFYPVHGNC